MCDTVDTLPGVLSVLRAMILSLASELTDRDTELKSRVILIEKLKHRLARLWRHRFGSHSESLDQCELTLKEEKIARAVESPRREHTETPNREMRRPKRRPLPARPIESGRPGPGLLAHHVPVIDDADHSQFYRQS